MGSRRTASCVGLNEAIGSGLKIGLNRSQVGGEELEVQLPGQLGDLAQQDHRRSYALPRREQHREIAVGSDHHVAVRGGAVEDLGVRRTEQPELDDVPDLQSGVAQGCTEPRRPVRVEQKPHVRRHKDATARRDPGRKVGWLAEHL